MYPVPSFKVDTETPDALDNGTKTEYTVDTAMPVIHVYLRIESAVSSISGSEHLQIGT
jgi:hypothetical protein